MDLQQRFTEYVQSNQLFTANDHLLLAVSGGVDSVVLAEICRRAGYRYTILHCNFQLRGEESNRDEEFMRKLAERTGAALMVKRFDTKQYKEDKGISTQEAARELRYAWFDEVVKELKTDKQNAWLLTAHHADDNIETAAMNYFRGTGIRGLRGMLPRNGTVIRPLLFARRKEIEDYAWLHQLEFVTDSSNLEEAYARNFFRLRLIPLFKAVYPDVEQNLLHNLDRFSESEQLYNQAIGQYRKKLLEKKGNEWHIPVLKLQHCRPLRTIVFEIISPFNFTAKQTDDVIGLLQGDTGKFVASADYRIFRNRKWLVISPLKTTEADHILIGKEVPAIAYAGGTLEIEQSSVIKPAGDPAEAVLDANRLDFPLLLRRWKQGDYFYPLGMKKKKKISRFLIDKKLSLSEKENVWVLESAKRIIWVVGHRIDDRFKITDDTKSVIRLLIRP